MKELDALSLGSLPTENKVATAFPDGFVPSTTTPTTETLEEGVKYLCQFIFFNSNCNEEHWKIPRWRSLLDYKLRFPSLSALLNLVNLVYTKGGRSVLCNY